LAKTDTIEKTRSALLTISVGIGLIVVLLGVGGWNARIEVQIDQNEKKIQEVRAVQKEYSETIKNIQLLQASQSEFMKHLAEDQREIKEDLKTLIVRESDK
jgi:hypothetical protein